MEIPIRRVVANAALALAALGSALPGQTPQRADTAATGAPVVFGGDTLVTVYGRIGPFTAVERAEGIARRLGTVGRAVGRGADSIVLVEGETHTDLVVGDVVLMTVLDGDAAPLGRPRAEVAADYASRLARALEVARRRTTIQAILLGLVRAVIVTVVLAGLLRLLSWVFPRTYATLERWRDTRIPSIRIQRLELMSARRLTDALLAIARGLRVALVVLLLYLYVPLVLKFFPWTEPLAGRILGYVLSPLRQVGLGFANYLPKMFFIGVILIVARYLLRLIRLIFDAVRVGTLAVPGFYREWAEPTYKIVRFLVMAFVLVVVFPYLPGADSQAFQGVSIFLGVLFSLGSSSAIANVVAGIVLTYTRAFQIGDRVKIADTVGDVMHKTLLATHVRTVKNVIVTVPNAMVLGSHIINYSSEGRSGNLILHTGVTIGYDAPWRRVHELLVAAAKATPNVKAEPEPFVLQTSLDDFYVRYELNAYTDRPDAMAATYSDLHQNIQDRFNEAGVEIMSPHYGAVRDGNRTAIPSDYLPTGYQAPAFRIGPFPAPGQAGR